MKSYLFHFCTLGYSALARVSCALLACATVARAEEKLQFNRDIRPILSDMCFQCHGPDGDNRKSDYRLDVREAALKGGKSEVSGLIPGKATESEIINRILSEDDEEHMPPKKSGKHLKPDQIATLKRWINEGAEYQGHWAFSEVSRPPTPGKRPNPIDSFVEARLNKEKLRPSPEAEKGPLLRRVSLDLTGLPPSQADLESFLNDHAPDAYEKAVDRLLSSPHYGEKMAIQWLDFARYADSNGFQSDGSRKMSIWRDWVINSFNKNLPFDQFTIEQMAGDLLPNAREEQVVATGFHRNHRINGEGGLVEAEWFAETVIDRVETTGATWLALTVGCARCHDHKFDPLTQKEFYQLFAFFNSVDETGVLGGDQFTVNTKPFLTFPTPEQTAKLASLEENIALAKAALKEAEAKDAADGKKREKNGIGEAQKWQILQPSELKSTNGATLTAETNGIIFSSGNQPQKDIYSVSADTDLAEVTGIRLELLPDERLPSKGSGRHANGNPIISEIRLTSSNKADGSQKEHVLKDATADFNQKGFDVTLSIDGKANTGWAVHPETGKPHSATFQLSEPLHLPGGGVLTFTIEQNYGAGAILGKFRISATNSPIPPQAAPEVLAALKTPPAQGTDAKKKKSTETQKQNGGAAATAAKAKMEAATKAKVAFEKSIDSTMVMRERAEPRVANVLLRGQYDQLGEAVPRGVPAALPPLPAGAPENRLGLAQWIVSPENPLTARVWVNRAWEKFFGTGIVKSSENFGSQSDWPSHPELLDWLSAEFMKPTLGTTVAGQPAQNWDMKALQKLIVMSSTYRQSAKVTPELLEKDPDNRLLARGPRFRLSGEILRDSALAVSGLLSEKIGGPSVRPYMPKGVWDETSVYGDLLKYQSDKGEDLYRRTLYTIWKRTAAPPTALLFDAPNREVCSVKRSRTNTPMQALALLNEITYVEAARKLAENMIQQGGSTAKERITWAFQRITARTPQASEVDILLNGLEKQLALYSANSSAAQELLSFGDSKSPETIPAGELAAYTVSANVLLNMDEFISR
jgi:hypothetical protein